MFSSLSFLNGFDTKQDSLDKHRYSIPQNTYTITTTRTAYKDHTVSIMCTTTAQRMACGCFYYTKNPRDANHSGLNLCGRGCPTHKWRSRTPGVIQIVCAECVEQRRKAERFAYMEALATERKNAKKRKAVAKKAARKQGGGGGSCTIL